MKRQKLAWYILNLLLLLLLSACRSAEPAQQAETGALPAAFAVSNLADPESRGTVQAILTKVLPETSVERFLEAVEDYNHSVQNTSLTKGFVPDVPAYDMATITALWSKEKGSFIGFNCRITAFQLLKDSLTIPEGERDAHLLFLDQEAMAAGKCFNDAEREAFCQLFSRVKTESTADIQLHAQKMKAHLAPIRFHEKARMISVIVHDNLDGDYLFVGHVGVLLEDSGRCLFVEKLSFEKPYQALVFPTKADCFHYLLERYADYSDEGAAKPFIMDNAGFAAP